MGYKTVIPLRRQNQIKTGDTFTLSYQNGQLVWRFERNGEEVAAFAVDFRYDGPVPQTNVSTEPTPPPFTSDLIGHWTFQGENGLLDLTGNFSPLVLKGARIEKGALDVGPNAYAIAEKYEGPPVSNKTLLAWVRMDDLDQRGGSVLTLDKKNKDEFDGIVYGERIRRKWMPGSNHYARSNWEFPAMFEENKTSKLISSVILR